jgi:N6-adenosine-specific RNA methylase IME4
MGKNILRSNTLLSIELLCVLSGIHQMKKYQIIYADPPWDYGNTKNLQGKFWGMADRHYPVMKFSDILSLPISDIADKNSLT